MAWHGAPMKQRMREREAGAQQGGDEREQARSGSASVVRAQVGAGLGPVDERHAGALRLRRCEMRVLLLGLLLLRARVGPLLLLPPCCAGCVLALQTRSGRERAERVVTALTQRHRRSLADRHVLRYRIQQEGKMSAV